MTGDQIRALRIKAGLTQKQLADKTGFHEKAINRWEAGKVKPMRANIMILEQVFKDLDKKDA